MPVERNYDIHDRELLAIIHGLRTWRHLLLSLPHTITIYTDYKNLTYYRQANCIVRRVARYLGELANYDFKLVHKPGTANKADHLSRCPDYDTGTNGNKDVVVLPPHLFVNAANMLSLEQEVYEVQKEHEGKIEELRKTHPFDQVNGHWFHKGRPVVPNKQELQRRILQQHHDHKMAGHSGIANTMIVVMREYWWPEAKKFITAYVQGCATCQSTKPNTVHPKPPIMPIISEQVLTPFHTIAMDLITDLPTSQGVRTSAWSLQIYVPFATDNFRYHRLAPSHVPLHHMTPPDPL